MVRKTVYFLIDCSDLMRNRIREVGELMRLVTDKLLKELEGKLGDDLKLDYAVYGTAGKNGGYRYIKSKNSVSDRRYIIFEAMDFRGGSDIMATAEKLYSEYEVNSKTLKINNGLFKMGGETVAPPLIVALSNGFSLDEEQRKKIENMCGSVERTEQFLSRLFVYCFMPNSADRASRKGLIIQSESTGGLLLEIRKCVLDYVQAETRRDISGKIYVRTLPVAGDGRGGNAQPVHPQQGRRDLNAEFRQFKPNEAPRPAGGNPPAPQEKPREVRPLEQENQPEEIKREEKPAESVTEVAADVAQDNLPQKTEAEKGGAEASGEPVNGESEAKKESGAEEENPVPESVRNAEDGGKDGAGESGVSSQPAGAAGDYSRIIQDGGNAPAGQPMGQSAGRTEVGVSGGEVNTARIKTVAEMTFTEARDVAYAVAEFFAGKGVSAGYRQALKVLAAAVPAVCMFEERMVQPVLDCLDKPTDAQQNNVAVACVIFYALSKGRYVQDVWAQAAKRKENTPLGAARAEGKRFAEACGRDFGGKFGEEINKTVERMRLNAEREDIFPLLQGGEAVGIAKLYEMLWEVFTDKYCNYTPMLWQRKISEFKNKQYGIREGCEFKHKTKKFEIYGVSYEGKLDKPSHGACEDCSFVEFYDEDTFLAVAADGVGSCINSSLGSLLATNCLYDVIAESLDMYNIITTGKKKWFSSKGPDWAGLMQYFKGELAVNFYHRWEESIKVTEDYLRADNPQMNQFTTTMQFVFRCEEFVACGRLGDGSFFVRKREVVNDSPLYGGLMLNDGISGVTQSAVMTVAHLKSNPEAMLVNFFSPREVTDVIISSDGVTCSLGESVAELNAFVNRIDAMPFEKRCDYLAKVARSSSDYNTTQSGSGDDSTLIHVRLNVSGDEPVFGGGDGE